MSTETDLKKCPYCSKYLLNQRAVICIHCGRHVATGEAIPTKITAKPAAKTKAPAAIESPAEAKTETEKHTRETSPKRSGGKAVYALKLAAAVALVIFALAWLLKAYNESKTSDESSGMNAAANAGSEANAAGSSAFPRPGSAIPEVLAGNAVETKETIDETATETMLKTIAECDSSVFSPMPAQGSKEIKVLVSGNVRFNPNSEQPVRIKIYRSAANNGNSTLIYNELFKDFKKPEIRHLPPQQMFEQMEQSLARMKEAQKRSPDPAREQTIATLERQAQQRALMKKTFTQQKISSQGKSDKLEDTLLTKMKNTLARLKETQQRTPNKTTEESIVNMEQQIKEYSLKQQNGGQNTSSQPGIKPAAANNNSMFGAFLNFRVADTKSLDSGSNNVFYKIKLCSESGLVLLKSHQMRVQLAPRPVLADDLKTWTWTPFFPGKDTLDGSLQDGQKNIPVSNVMVQGQLANALSKENRAKLPVYFRSSSVNWNNSWRYSRKFEQNFNPDEVAVRPVFSSDRFFDVKGPIELKSLKVDGRKVSMQPGESNSYRVAANGSETKMTNQKVPLNYPGTPVVELEFIYGGKTNTLRVQLPPAPTGLQARLQEDGSVKLTWDPLADRIDHKQFPVPPDLKLLRHNVQGQLSDAGHTMSKVIKTCDINQTEFIDKETEPGKIYAYSLVMDNVNAKVQSWTKEKGVIESKALLKDLANPYPDNSKAAVYTYPENPPARPARISFWEPALCYERTGGPGMQLFSAAVRKLGQNAEFEVLDRTSRNNVIEEKILTMSYEKSIMIKTLPADFTVLVRDYSRQQGNGVELWLIQNKTFDYKPVKLTKGWVSETFADNNFIVWRVGSISADELNIQEKAEEIGGKLVEEIKQRLFFKSAAAAKDSSVPKKFVFNPMESVRQKIMVVENKAIGESIMVGLSGLMPDCNIMTRDSWKTLFNEQNLIREQGENLDSDISGTVLISSRVWMESDKKQYLFNLTDIKTGICVGSLQCSGSIEDVTAQLAESCKKIKLPVPVNSELTAQTKNELNYEHRKIRECFMERFGLSNSHKLHESLTPTRQEMSKPEFAREQWKLGNKENAIKILEEMWKTSKSAWWQLKSYHCEMGNYPRALEIVEAIMQQKNASNSLIPEYYRLRAIIAANVKPKAAENLQTAAASSAKPKRDSTRRMKFGTTFESESNMDSENSYSERMSAKGMEWNPGGECRTMIKWQIADALKYEEWIHENALHNSGMRTNMFKDVSKNLSGRSDALWESIPLFKDDDTMALSRTINLLGGWSSAGASINVHANQTPQESFSMIRALFAIAQNPYVKLTPAVQKIKDEPEYGDKEQWQRNKDAAECDAGYKFIEYYFKEIMRDRKKVYKRIDLSDMICIDIAAHLDRIIMARNSNSDAQELLCEINAVELPRTIENFHNFKAGNFEPYDLLAFKVYRGDRDACKLALKGLLADKGCLGYRDHIKSLSVNNS